MVHAEPNTGYFHFLWRNYYLNSLGEEWSGTVILNQGMIVVKTWFTNAWLNASLRNENNQSTKLSYSIQYPSIYLLAHKTQDLVTINYTIIRKLNLPVYSYRNDLIFLINYLHIDLNILVRSFCSLVEHTMVQGEIYVVPYIILLISQ